MGALGLGAIPALSGCGGSHTTTVVSAGNADVEVLNAYLPQPPSPDVASVYFELRNLTGQSETLLSVSSAAATQTVPMSEGGDAMPGMQMSAGQMMPLGHISVPPHGTFSFTPGHNHLMLEGLRRHLSVGQTVVVELRFDHAAALTVDVPVVPLDRILGSGA